MLLKTCRKCFLEQPLNAFTTEKRNKDGRYPYCKSCCRSRNVAYRLRDSTHVHHSDLPRRFWRKVAVTANPDKCWLWIPKPTRYGYGTISAFGNTEARSNRVAFFLGNGFLPADKLICHSCNTRACCNPRHLYAGNPMSNTIDKCLIGHAIKKVPLPDAMFIYLARGTISAETLASRFGVTKHTIWNIWSKRTHKYMHTMHTVLPGPILGDRVLSYAQV